MNPWSLKKSAKAVRILAAAYARHLVQRTPVWGHLYVTRHCNLRCAYCFFRDPHKPDLGEEELKRVIDRMWALGIRFLAFHGGEPTLRPDFLRIVRHAHDRGFFLYLNTNGTRLTAEYVEALGEAGVDLVNLSVDSVIDFEHSHKDLAHSKEVLGRLVAARARRGFEITVNFVLTNQNLPVLRPTLEVMRELGVPVSIGLIVKHLYREDQEQTLFFRTTEEQARLFATLDELTTLRRAGYNFVEPAQYFQDLKRFVRGELEWECLAGRDSIGVDTLGELKFCGTLPTEPISIFDLDRLDTQELYRLRREKYGDCHRRCVTNCRYVTWYYHEHPARFVLEMAAVPARLRRGWEWLERQGVVGVPRSPTGGPGVGGGDHHARLQGAVDDGPIRARTKIFRTVEERGRPGGAGLDQGTTTTR